ncbi:MAG TPA: hypothetical protein PKC18_14755, partial [Lacipirellulaceae bacterium]|nr:hypothetical protein [Lacipirellulaceae bacterium]
MPDPIIFEAGQTGLDCYVRFDDAGDTAVALTAGSGLKATRYTASAGDLVGAALPAGTYYPNIFAGTASSQSTSDQWLAEVDAFHWSGTLEIPSWDKLIAAREGYNNVLEVGAGQPYATIISATNAAVAGDLVVVPPGTYNQSELGKNGVTLWFAPGAVVEIDAQDDSPMFDSSVTNLRVLGFGKFHTGIDGRLYNGTIA